MGSSPSNKPPSSGSASPSQRKSLPPIEKDIGPYRVKKVLGRGASAVVYLAVHREIGREVAIKVLDSGLTMDPKQAARFLQEAQVVNRIKHPGIIEVHDLISLENPPRRAMIMEYVAGPTLARALRDGPFTEIQAVEITLQLAQALAAMHQRGIIHRDMKPANVLLIGARGEDFSTHCLKIGDFGLAKMAQGGASLTALGLPLGTPRYMAPEQIAGEEATDKTDIYALGEMFYELIAGEPMFEGTAQALMTQKLVASPRPELPHVSAESEAIERLISACIAEKPELRPSIDQLVDQLIGLRARLKGELAAATVPDVDSVLEGMPLGIERTAVPESPIYGKPTGFGRAAIPTPPAPLPASPPVVPPHVSVPPIATPVEEPKIEAGQIVLPEGPSGLEIDDPRARAALANLKGKYRYPPRGSKIKRIFGAILVLGALGMMAVVGFAFVAGKKPGKVSTYAPRGPGEGVEIVTEPRGAEVYDTNSGLYLGTTPLTLHVPKGKLLLVDVRLIDYYPRNVQLDGSEKRVGMKLEKLENPGFGAPFRAFVRWLEE